MRTFALAVTLATLTGCATQKYVYVRADGQRLFDDPVLQQQFKMDATVCEGDTNKAGLSGVAVYGGGLAGAAATIDRANAVGRVAVGCMAEKGYVQVPEEQAGAERARLAEIEAEKKRRAAQKKM
jgi:hypothetical protein